MHTTGIGAKENQTLRSDRLDSRCTMNDLSETQILQNYRIFHLLQNKVLPKAL